MGDGLICGLIFNLSLRPGTEPCTPRMPRKMKGGGVELDSGDSRKMEGAKENISDNEIILFVLLFPLSTTISVSSIYG